MLNTDVQLAKVTFLQKKNASDNDIPGFNVIVNGAQGENTGAGNYHPMTTVTLNAGQRAGYKFDGWKVTEGNVVLDDAKQPVAHFTMPKEKVVVEATWVAIPYTVEVLDSYAKDTGAGQYTVEDTVTVRAGQRDGYDFGGWKVTAGELTLEQPNNPEITFKMPAENVTLQATWTKQESVAPKPDETEKPDETTEPQDSEQNNTTPSKPDQTRPDATSPVTGDNSNIAAWLLVMLLAASAICIVIYKKRRSHKD